MPKITNALLVQLAAVAEYHARRSATGTFVAKDVVLTVLPGLSDYYVYKIVGVMKDHGILAHEAYNGAFTPLLGLNAVL